MDGLERILRSLRRPRPPDIAIEAIFERWHRRRRLQLALGGLAAAAAVVAVTLLRPAETEPPPVHLQLRVVDVPAEDLGGGEPEGVNPQETRGP
ncbi:MAG: hypothetical protein ACYTEZ_12690 [Planctomycetota bacterium]|jgi:hypothetical protein